jgi:hypothetical protein
MRTNRIELTKYLFHRRDFIIVTFACFCDWFKQTLKHVVLFYFNHNRTRKRMLIVVEMQNLRRLLNINKRVRMITRWLMKIDILAQFSLTIECLEWFRSVMWAKRMHTKSINRSQYFDSKLIMRRLDDERTEEDFYFSEDFSFIYIVYSNFRMSRLKSMTQRVWSIIIIIYDTSSRLWRFIHWAKSKNHRSRKVLKIFDLIRRNQKSNVLEYAKNFNIKMRLLIKFFFFDTTNANLNDISI